jgi:hypothetical protein
MKFNFIYTVATAGTTTAKYRKNNFSKLILCNKKNETTKTVFILKKQKTKSVIQFVWLIKKTYSIFGFGIY